MPPRMKDTHGLLPWSPLRPGHTQAWKSIVGVSEVAAGNQKSENLHQLFQASWLIGSVIYCTPG